MKNNSSEKTSTISQVLLWFGAAISIAEIQTGALIAPLGFRKGLLAILVGHIIGAAVLYPAGIIGAETRLPAIESTRISFGIYGSYGFSVLNILQLLGWTAIMILNGAIALSVITEKLFHFQNQALWSALIGALICVWIAIGIRNLSKVNALVVSVLFILSVLLGVLVFRGGAHEKMLEGSMTFGAAVELSVAMMLSWLPLISDYTRTVRHERAGTLGGVLGYFFGSSFMFTIGLGGALYAGTPDIAAILMPAGLSVSALVIVVFSTVTTTFLDAYSAGVSALNLNGRIPEKAAALLACAIGIVLAVFVPIGQYENFLYLIGSVFAPLFAILLTDFFILHTQKVDPKRFYNLKNTALWIIGILIYRLLLPLDSPAGATLPVMVLLSVLCVLVNGGINRWKKNR